MREQGNSNIIMLVIVLIILVIGASAVSFYVLKSQGKTPASAYMYTNSTAKPAAKSQNANTVSDNDDVDTLETELNQTSAGEIDGDIQSLDSSAAAL